LRQDLAKHKRMSVEACLEEMLLHTNEGVGPHTKTTLHCIQDLRKKHGIDYGNHASYRFVEDRIGRAEPTTAKGCRNRPRARQ
jgi:hypothetical protein